MFSLAVAYCHQMPPSSQGHKNYSRGCFEWAHIDISATFPRLAARQWGKAMRDSRNSRQQAGPSFGRRVWMKAMSWWVIQSLKTGVNHGSERMCVRASVDVHDCCRNPIHQICHPGGPVVNFWWVDRVRNAGVKIKLRTNQNYFRLSRDSKTTETPTIPAVVW